MKIVIGKRTTQHKMPQEEKNPADSYRQQEEQHSSLYLGNIPCCQLTGLQIMLEHRPFCSPPRTLRAHKHTGVLVSQGLCSLFPCQSSLNQNLAAAGHKSNGPHLTSSSLESGKLTGKWWSSICCAFSLRGCWSHLANL